MFWRSVWGNWFSYQLLLGFGCQLLTSQIVCPPPAYAFSPVTARGSPLDFCFAFCIFAVENWESDQAYGSLFEWKRVEWTFLYLKYMWGSGVLCSPYESHCQTFSPTTYLDASWLERGVIWFHGMLTWTCGLPNDLKWVWKVCLCLKPFR